MLGPFLTLLGLGPDADSDNDDDIDKGGKRAGSQAHNVARRRQQIQQLAGYLSTVRVKRSSRRKVVESVRQVSEAVIWSDRHERDLLSTVIEMELPEALLRLLRPRTRRGDGDSEKAVAVQTLQTLSIILDSVTDERFIMQLLSNNFVNRLISAPAVDAAGGDDELVAYYVAFLKALSLRLTPTTIHLFFNERLDDFPLFTAAIALFDHPDAMVRVAVRAITLNVMRVNDAGVLEFLLTAPSCAPFWEQVVCALRDSCDDAFRLLVDAVLDSGAPAEPQQWAALDQILERHMGLLAYVNDVFGLGVTRISRRLAAEFSDRIAARTFVHAVDIGWRAGASPEETLFMQVATLFLAHFFSIVKYSPLLLDTVAALFSPEGSDRLERPFVPSPFEPSRTLVPWLAAVLEILRNKAISPTALAKSVLAPRRMLRTRALLSSLTGAPSPDCGSGLSDFSGSGPPTMSPIFTRRHPAPTPPMLPDPVSAQQAEDDAQPLPPFAQTIATAMGQILTASPPAHTWLAVDLASLVLIELTRTSRGQIVLDSGLREELLVAQRALSADLRALLLEADADRKSFVRVLVDLANSTPEALAIKVQFEARHVFDSGADDASNASLDLAARIHQAIRLRHLCHPGPAPAFVRDLQNWLGQDPTISDPVFNVTMADGPESIAAKAGCTPTGCLVITGSDDQVLLAWPLADTTIESTIDGKVHIRDARFPPLFFAQRPPALGGISIAPRRTRLGKKRKPAVSYLGSRRPLDITLHTDAELRDVLQKAVSVSRERLADIFFTHNIF